MRTIPKEERDQMRRSWGGTIIWHRLRRGVFNLTTPLGLSIIFIFVLSVLITWVFRFEIVWASPIEIGLRSLIETGFASIYLVLFFSLLLLLGTPLGNMASSLGLQRIGLRNTAGEVPVLIDRKRNSKEAATIYVLEYLSLGIPLSAWISKRGEIESALNLHITDIEQGRNMNRIILHVVSGETQLPNMVRWERRYLSSLDFVLVLGFGYLGLVQIDLAKIPHILIGGSTNSGKSVLLKMLLLQCVEKGAMVFVADFKGGVDFPGKWKQMCHLVCSKEDMLEMLQKTTQELKKRRLFLAKSEFTNIGEYNAAVPMNERMRRIIIACDEAAELLDRTGLDKEEKQLVIEIEKQLSMIARQGRAFGIHLILATQRPDATIISGQIRNNINCCICGRADQVLSQIILDNSDASKLIPKSARGRFLMNDGTVFQGYLFDEKTIFMK